MTAKRYSMLARLKSAIKNIPTEKLGVLIDVANKLGNDSLLDFNTKIKHLLRDEVEIVEPEIINWLGTTKTSATIREFVAKEKFTKDSKEVKFYAILDYFTERFLTKDSKIENSLGIRTLRYGNLTKNSVDRLIISALSGEAKAETTLTELWDLLKKQPKGEEGFLLTNGCANIFYIRDVEGELRAVVVDWHVTGWRLAAYLFKGSWSVGDRVFCRNS